MHTATTWIPLSLLAVVLVIVLAGCTAGQTAADLSAVDAQWDDAAEALERLPATDAERETIDTAWEALSRAREDVRTVESSGDAERVYLRARTAYMKLYGIILDYYDDMPPADQRLAERLHERAQRIDEQAERAHQERLVELLETAAAIGRLAERVGVR